MAGQDIRHEFCTGVSSEGFRCVGYKDHLTEGVHWDQHAKHRWTDVDPKAVKHAELNITPTYDHTLMMKCVDCDFTHEFEDDTSIYIPVITIEEINKIAAAHTESMKAH